MFDHLLSVNIVQHGQEPDLAEEGGALLGHLRHVLVELQWLCELVHEEVSLFWLLLRKILHLALQEHQAAVQRIQLIPHMLEDKGCTVCKFKKKSCY